MLPLSDIPYRVPLFEDPRAMERKLIISELKRHGLNEKGPSPVLSARLLSHIVHNELQKTINPYSMDDRQPEKWLRIANLQFEIACNLEKDPEARIKCMTRSVSLLHCYFTQLLEIAKGNLFPPHETPLFQALLRFGAALAVLPVISREATTEAGVSSDAVRASLFIFSLCTGFCPLPDHSVECPSE
jgi:hypothetical protein